LRNGAKVAINYLGGPTEDSLVEAFSRDAAAIAATAEKRFITVPGNISRPETGKDLVAKTVEAFGRLDVFVSNAGVCQFAEFLE
jgi:L-rhamnose 1-dehydrogenase